MEYTTRTLWINKKKRDRKEWEQLLFESNLLPEENVDEVVGIYQNAQLIAVGSRQKNILKCLAVHQDFKGGNVFNQVVTEIMKRIEAKGYSSFYVYTKAKNVDSFLHLGFKEIIRTSYLVFLEKSINNINGYLTNLANSKVEADKITSIVMNANPFTLGHQYLVEKAAAENDVVHLFVVSEDRSFFPANAREKLVAKGTKHLKNVCIHSTAEYIVSTQTFPSYFLPEDTEVIRVQAELDAVLFLKKIAPVLNISSRYVGEEPYSESTEIYNQVMRKTFNNEIELIESARRTTNEKNDFISATKVRNLIMDDQIQQTKRYVPETTFEFLISNDGQNIINQAKKDMD